MHLRDQFVAQPGQQYQPADCKRQHRARHDAQSVVQCPADKRRVRAANGVKPAFKQKQHRRENGQCDEREHHQRDQARQKHKQEREHQQFAEHHERHKNQKPKNKIHRAEREQQRNAHRAHQGRRDFQNAQPHGPAQSPLEHLLDRTRGPSHLHAEVAPQILRRHKGQQIVPNQAHPSTAEQIAALCPRA